VLKEVEDLRFSYATRWGLTVLTAILAAMLAATLAPAPSSIAGEDKDKPGAVDLKKRLRELRSLPYTSVTSTEVDSTRSGVTVFDASSAYPGYNLFCGRLSAEVSLLDMEGNLVHKWAYPEEEMRIWNQAALLPDGDVVVIRKFHDVIRLDWDSNLLWSFPAPAHHEIVPMPDGTFYTIARDIHVHRGLRVRFPSLVRFNDDGELLDFWSTYENLDEIKQKFDQRDFIDTILDSLLEGEVDPETWEPTTKRARMLKAEIDAWPLRYDQFHMNTITVLPHNPLEAADPRFKAGNLLICFRNINQIAILQRDTKEILWVWGADHLDWPHHPTMVESGNILVFDNGTKRKHTRILELNPITLEIEWEYKADPPEAFYTPEKGSAHRFPNGNTLICEGDMGRVFEITREGRIVWEWLNPAMKAKRREQIYRMDRYPPEMVEPLLKP
jgi:hypothetical protein